MSHGLTVKINPKIFFPRVSESLSARCLGLRQTIFRLMLNEGGTIGDGVKSVSVTICRASWGVISGLLAELMIGRQPPDHSLMRKFYCKSLLFDLRLTVVMELPGGRGVASSGGFQFDPKNNQI